MHLPTGCLVLLLLVPVAAATPGNPSPVDSLPGDCLILVVGIMEEPPFLDPGLRPECIPDVGPDPDCPLVEFGSPSSTLPVGVRPRPECALEP